MSKRFAASVTARSCSTSSRARLANSNPKNWRTCVKRLKASTASRSALNRANGNSRRVLIARPRIRTGKIAEPKERSPVVSVVAKNAARSAETDPAPINVRKPVAADLPNAKDFDATRDLIPAGASLGASSGPEALGQILASQRIALPNAKKLDARSSEAGPAIATASTTAAVNAPSSGRTGLCVPTLVLRAAMPHHPSSQSALSAANNLKAAPRDGLPGLALSAPGAPVTDPHALRVSHASTGQGLKTAIRIVRLGPTGPSETPGPASISAPLKIGISARAIRTAHLGAIAHPYRTISALAPFTAPEAKIAALRAARAAAARPEKPVRIAPAVTLTAPPASAPPALAPPVNSKAVTAKPVVANKEAFAPAVDVAPATNGMGASLASAAHKTECFAASPR